ncbi:hypothetical protein GCM10025882_28490 [Acinetobacter gyllenbergii]|uniref:Uncharacterized protein n=1 Tax=Acinetobacter gyllenbergii CIP 110306 = MTCC 11365 TaxID=1217657 RepID=A0A829HLX1_9GAMM|nr:hypothetical protein [Acinetobacter gyllenbergii]EPF88074.1 hypothetical protein F957_01361 [Acinetobacter gyllenbergii CIP 110306 = MTCC 11365]EPH35850.1 hypothetical protein L293_0443 [Acinetobacter gyllenbergii CIP 110306 = MTCC 11365]ESK55667.1 hypothetical protein F987_00524 [Acinetobacter gyllenbergii NIPH 230]MCU4579893.1 hypothetical protein [Acinetobacter gyllenbergii]GMA12424.1 hypothetical protein GCM10025882_28490 [Acinetobacter gyllenbergii]
MKMNFVVVTRLLKQSQSILKSGYLVFVLSVVSLFLFSSIPILIPLLLVSGLLAIHHYLFIRIEFDRGLLQYMVDQPEDIDRLTQQLDQSLLNLKLIPANKTGREWSERFKGCLKLLKIQIAIVLVQYAVFIILFYKLAHR